MLLVALLGLAAGRTWIAGTMLKARLLGFGLEDVSLTVSALNQSGLVIEHLTANDGTLTVARAEATYKLADLAKGRIDRVTVSGLRAAFTLDPKHGLRLGGRPVADMARHFAPSPGTSAGPPLTAVEIKDAAMSLVAPQGTANGTFELRAAARDGVWKSKLDLQVKGPDILLEAHGEGGVDMGSPERSRGRITISAAVANLPVPPLADALSFQGTFLGEVQSGSLTVTSTAPVSMSIHGLAGSGLVADQLGSHVTINLGKFAWSQSLAGFDAAVTLSDGALDGEHFAAGGIAASVHVARPGVLQGAQHIAARSVSVGDSVVLSDVEADLAIKAGTLAINRAGFGIAGGRVTARDILLPGSKGFMVEVDRIDLHALAAMAKTEGLNVTGTVSGQLPVAIDGAAMSVAQGTLAADGSGVIRYRPAAPPPSLAGSPGGALALKALSHFKFDSLAMNVNGALADEMALTLAVSGRNPDLYNGYPIALNLNLTGKLAEILRQGFGAARVPDAAVQELRGTPPPPKKSE